MYFKIIIICLLLSITQTSYAQNIDSLLNVRNDTKSQLEKYELTIRLVEISTDKRQWENSFTYVNEALAIAKSLADKNRIAEVYLLSGRMNLTKGEYSKADSLFLLGLDFASYKDLKAKLYSGRFSTVIRTGKLENAQPLLKSMRSMIEDTTSLLMADYYFNNAGYYTERHDILNTLQYLQKAKKLFLVHGRSTRMINHNLTVVFEDLKDYENILKIQMEIWEDAKKNKDYFAEIFSLYGIMTAQKGLEDYDNAKKSCYNAINLKNTHQISMAFGYVYLILGEVHLETGQLDSAAYYFQKGIEISEKQQEEKELSENHAALAALLFDQGKIQEAKFHAEKTWSLIKYTHAANNTLLAKIYDKEGNYQKAYELLNINWSEIQKKEEDRTDYKVIAALLNEKFEQEKAQEQLLFQQKLDKQRQLLIGGILTLSLILLMTIILIQIRNNKQLKGLNQQLSHRNNALQQFSFIASHDIKEPMRSIGNYVELIKRMLSETDQKRLGLYFDNIKSGLQQIYTLIEDVMEYTQVNQNRPIDLKMVNLTSIVKNVEIGLELFIAEKGGKITYDNLPEINSSNSILFMVLKNLIQNGLKFNQSDVPTVEINYEKTQTHHQIIVSDNGIGIDEQYHEKIFEMFKRLQKRSDYEGSGIGLAIVKLSVEKLGGTIRLESEEGKGSRFVIQLPL